MIRVILFSISILLIHPYSASATESQIRWSVPLPGNIGSSVAYDTLNNKIFLGSADGTISSLDLDGNILWQFKTGGHIAASPVLSSNAETVYISSYDNHLYALNATTGSLLWAFNTGAKIYSSPAIDNNGVIYVGAENGYLFAISPDSGLEKWHYHSNSAISYTPAISQNRNLYFGTASGKLYSLSITEFESNPNATYTWQLSTEGTGITSPVLGLDGSIYVGSVNNKLYSVSPSGTLKWSSDLGSRITSSPVIDRQGTLFVTTFDSGSLNAVNANNGQLIWTLPLSESGISMYSSPAIGDDQTLYVGDFNGYIYAIDNKAYDINDLSSMFKWAIKLDSPVIASPLIKGGTLFVAAQNYNLYAIDISSGDVMSSPWPMSNQNHHRTSFQTNVDSDGDGLPDSWALNNNVSDATADSDSDGLSNYEEYLAFTDPNNEDTDLDGIPDGWEVSHGLDPLRNDANEDRNGDGISNLAEYENEQLNPPTNNFANIIEEATSLLGANITTSDNEIYTLSYTQDSRPSWPTIELRDYLPALDVGEVVKIKVKARVAPNNFNDELYVDVYSNDGNFIDTFPETQQTTVSENTTLENYEWSYKNTSGEKIEAPRLRFRFKNKSSSETIAYISELHYETIQGSLDYINLVEKTTPSSHTSVEEVPNEPFSYKLIHIDSYAYPDFVIPDAIPTIAPGEVLLVTFDGKTQENTDNKEALFYPTSAEGNLEKLSDSKYLTNSSSIPISATYVHQTRAYFNSGTSSETPGLYVWFKNISDPNFSAYIKNLKYRLLPVSSEIQWVQSSGRVGKGIFRRDASLLSDLSLSSLPSGSTLTTNNDDANIELEHDYIYKLWVDKTETNKSYHYFYINDYLPDIQPGKTLTLRITGRTVPNIDNLSARIYVSGLTSNTSVLIPRSDTNQLNTYIYTNNTAESISSPMITIFFNGITDPNFQAYVGNLEFEIN